MEWQWGMNNVVWIYLPRSLESLQAAKLLIHRYTLNVFNRNIIKACQQCQFVNGHILKHTLGISFETFTQTGSILKRIIKVSTSQMNRENNVVEKLNRLTFSYVLFDTKVTCDPGVEAANSRALRTYLHTFLLYPTMFGCIKEKLYWVKFIKTFLVSIR